jgi:hypothetical protein
MVGGYPLQRVSYRPVREKDDTLSVMRIAVDQGISDTPPPQSRLVTSLKGFRVEYLTAQGQWVRVWPQGGGVGGGLPRAPRLELEEQTGAAWHTTYSLPVGGPG